MKPKRKASRAFRAIKAGMKDAIDSRGRVSIVPPAETLDAMLAELADLRARATALEGKIKETAERQAREAAQALERLLPTADKARAEAAPTPPAGRRGGWGLAIAAFFHSAAAPARATTRAIAEALGQANRKGGLSRINAALQREKRAGHVLKIGRGVWALPGQSSAGANVTPARTDKTKCLDCSLPRWSKYSRCAAHQKAVWRTQKALSDAKRNGTAKTSGKTDEHAEALAWAKQHPDDPKAARILEIAARHE